MRTMLLLLLKRRLLKWWSKAPWLTLSALLAVLYFGGYGMMRWTEPPSNPIRSLPTYTYFFVITVATIGFGDVVPVSTGGRITASLIAIGGVGAAAVALRQRVHLSWQFHETTRKGLPGVRHERSHRNLRKSRW